MIDPDALLVEIEDALAPVLTSIVISYLDERCQRCGADLNDNLDACSCDRCERCLKLLYQVEDGGDCKCCLHCEYPLSECECGHCEACGEMTNECSCLEILTTLTEPSFKRRRVA